MFGVVLGQINDFLTKSPVQDSGKLIDKYELGFKSNCDILILFPVNKFGQKCISNARVVDLLYLFTMISKFAIFEHAE